MRCLIPLKHRSTVRAMSTRPGSDSDREFDIVVYGASGFTGKLVVEYLVSNYVDNGGALRLALAGRNVDKVRAVAQAAGAPELKVIVADSFDAKALQDMAARTRVVVTTVGPYAKYGEALVAACVEKGTDYCDLTGEALFVRRMIDAHHEAAVRAGTRVVHCCGYDSIPSDLGTLMVQEAYKERYGTYASQVKMAAGESSGGASGGTIASVLNMFDEMKRDPSLRRLLGDPYSLVPAQMRGPDKGDQAGVRFDKDFNMWTAPFVMAAINTRIVRRSHALLGQPWGKDFRYSEVMTTGSGPKGMARAAAVAGGLASVFGMIAMPLTRPLVEKRLPSPGEGPSKETRERGFFKVRLVALGNDAPIRGLVEGFKDPGYGGTAIMLGESAMCLAMDRAKLNSPGGVTTPAAAMGTRLIERLVDAGMVFRAE